MRGLFDKGSIPEQRTNPQQSMRPANQPINTTGESAQDPQEEKDLYDIFTAQGVKMAMDSGRKMQDPITPESLGEALYLIVDRIEMEGANHGIDFPMNVMLHGATEAMEALISSAGVEMQEEELRAAMGIAVGKYIQTGMDRGTVTPEKLQVAAEQAQQYAQDLEAEQQMEQSQGAMGGQRNGAY